jgi:hypothetical protein
MREWRGWLPDLQQQWLRDRFEQCAATAQRVYVARRDDCRVRSASDEVALCARSEVAMWEYKIGGLYRLGVLYFYEGNDDRTPLNDLGAQGWEVVSVWYDNNVQDTRALLKRRIDREEEPPW